MILATFDVYGTPAPQGSKKAFVAGGKAIIVETSGNHAVWRNQVAATAHEWALNNYGAPFDGALQLTATFRFPMPKTRPKTARALGTIHKTTAPDLSKLVRCIEDGIQAGGLIVDDARITTIHASKLETTGWTGASITIQRPEAP